MLIGNRGGHTRKSYGAVASLDEYVENRIVIKRVNELLSQYHTIVDCTPSDNSGDGEWNIGVNIANSNNVDLFFSIHFNSFKGAKGSECCVASSDKDILQSANKVCSNLESLGFVNRGVKFRDDLAECVGVKCPSMIIEVCFVQEPDASLYRSLGVEKIARAIANAIDSRISMQTVTISKVKVKWINVEGNLNPNSQIKISASTEKNGDWYKFWACNRENGEWIMVQDWSRTYNYAYFTPKSEGKYTFVAWVKNGQNTDVVSETEEDSYISVDKIIYIKSKINNININKDMVIRDENIIFTVDGSPNSLYKYFMCNRDTNNWIDLEDGKWIDKNSTSFTPTKNSKYSFVVWIKNKNNTTDIEDDYKAYDFKATTNECSHEIEIEKLKVENEQLEKEINLLRDKIAKVNEVLNG